MEGVTCKDWTLIKLKGVKSNEKEIVSFSGYSFAFLFCLRLGGSFGFLGSGYIKNGSR